MKVLLIDPFKQNIEHLEITGKLADIRAAIGFDTIESDEIGDDDDHLFFDEECFIREQPHPGRFRLDRLAPVAGRAVVVGGGPDEATLREPSISLDALQARVTFS